MSSRLGQRSQLLLLVLGVLQKGLSLLFGWFFAHVCFMFFHHQMEGMTKDEIDKFIERLDNLLSKNEKPMVEPSLITENNEAVRQGLGFMVYGLWFIATGWL